MIQLAHDLNPALLHWSRGFDSIGETEALALYERNWRLVDVNGIPAH